MLQTAVPIGASAAHDDGDFAKVSDFILECENLGVDAVWAGEAWGMDALTPLAYIAAKTTKMHLYSGVASVSARTPAALAMASLTLAAMSHNRFVLGLGVSGPQIVEGLHGAAFEKPLGRLKELVSVLRMAFSGDPLELAGEHYQIPKTGSGHKPLKLGISSEQSIPIYLAALGPKALEYTGEVADGWLAHSFTPSTASYYLDRIERGAQRAGRRLEDIKVAVGVVVGIGDDVERMISKRKPAIAFQLGAMGSSSANFYKEAFIRSEFEVDAVNEVNRLWLDGKRGEAIARVPDEMALETSIIGTPEMVRERVAKYEAAGVSLLQVQAMGRSPERKLRVLGELGDIIAQSKDATLPS